MTEGVLRYDGRTGMPCPAPGGTGALLVPSGSGGLSEPLGLAFGPDGDLYVLNADFLSPSILRYSGTTGAFIDSFVPSGGDLNSPFDLTFGPDGSLYVSNFGTTANSVLRYQGPTGQHPGAASPAPGKTGATFASGGGLLSATGLTFGPDGNLYVTSDDQSILRYNGTTGAFIDTFASGGGLTNPFGLAFGPDGNLYVSNIDSSGENSDVLRYNGTTGAFMDAFVPLGSGGLDRSVGLAFGPGGDLFVSSEGTNSVLRYDGKTGAFLGTFASGSGMDAPSYLTFSPANGPAAVVPEPGPLALLGLGLLPAAAFALRRRKV